MESERLLLRPILEKDYPSITKMNTADALTFFGFTTEDEVAAYVKKLHFRFFECSDGFRAWRVIEKSSLTVIGLMGFHSWVFLHDRAELGYHLTPEAQGKGYATEAGKLTVQHGFEELKLHRIEAFTGIENEASMNVLRKLGLTYEGRMKGHYKRDSVFYDAEVFGLIKPDYKSLIS